MRDTILFDIDYTLLNTLVFKENCRSKLSEFLNISVEDICVAEKGYVKKETEFTDFNPEEYIDYISKKYNVSTQDVGKAFFDDENFKNISYPEVVSLLEALSKNYKLGIFSEGFKSFQLLKLHKSGLLAYFDREVTFVIRRKLTQKSLDLLPKGSFVIDDNYFVADALCKAGSFKPIWLNRKTKEKHPDCETVFDLTNLKEVLGNYSKR
ncbi:MAG: HAD family hydrolase [Patescibacteria group bacterium]|nr:HAD family hydrolase [Patescibacteria group bacterium]MBU1952717.1 HAD family hydrolase [Patescibacteria group bacterium]